MNDSAAGNLPRHIGIFTARAIRRNIMCNTLVMVVDEHPLIRSAVTALIKRKGEQTLDTGCHLKAIKLITAYKPDLIILEILKQEGLALDFVKKIKAISPRSKILIFSALRSVIFIRKCLAAGVQGYVNKRESLDNLEGVIDAVLSGHCCFPDIDLSNDTSAMLLM
ncbi:response regulator [Yersinia rohdei]|uniref:response regulator n=1 Tax=Yersinia rohdei TaxID=29485 RepID=UPI0021BDA3A1|nr:response regulator transcription factor [Yersinia rohdei]